MAAPLISVVIPCFNQGRFLAHAIRSVHAPAMRSAEIVVVDDGSTDDTRIVAKQFSRVLYTYQSNTGLASARNRGLAESHGEFVVFLDADDMLAPGALDIGAAALEAHPECAFVTGRCVMMDALGHLQPTPEHPRLTSDAYTELLRHNYIWMPAMVMFRRTALVEAAGFNKQEHAAADYELYLRVARQRPAFDHAKVVAYYRQHGSNMSADASRMLRETLNVHGRERAHVMTDRVRLAAFKEGRHRWQEFYGTRLVEEIRRHVHAREWRRAARKAATLARYYPEGLRGHALKKLTLWLMRHRAVRDSL
jgi:glycosyltransferase involved in cell wall biosynthesis